MSVNELPTEILLLIFKNLPGKDAANCRRVCYRWKDVVDSFKDNDWKVYCKNDYHYVHAAYKKASLSWRELYKSLSLWSKIDSATMTAMKFPMKTAQFFQILDNGVIGVCENHSNDIINILLGYSDTIVYYDIETLKEIYKESLGFSFSSYKENENLICVIDRIGRLCVILKETKERFFIGQLPQYDSGPSGEYSLFEEQVYFQANDNTLNVAKIKCRKNGKLFIKSYELEGIGSMEETVLAFNCVTNIQLIILTDDFNKGNMYVYRDKELGTVTDVDKYHRGMIRMLEDFGFDWTDPAVLHWMFRTFSKQTIHVTKLKNSSICSFGTTILLGTYRRMINIYANPYTPHGELKLHNAKPTRRINMNDISKSVSPFREIQQMDAVEIENGHKIIVLSDDQLFAIELLHEDKNKHGKKQKRVKNTSLEVSRAPKKKPKVMTSVKVVIKGRKGNNNTKASTSQASENSQRRKKAGPEASISRKKKMPKDSSKSEASIAEEKEPKDMSPSQVSTRHQGKKQSKDTSLETPSKLKKKVLKVSPLEVRTCSPTKKRRLKDSSLLPPNNQDNTKILRSSQGVKQKKTSKVTYQTTPKHKYATRATTKI